MDLVALGIKVSFLDFTDVSTAPFPFLCFSVYVIQNTFIFPAVVAWLVFAMMLHFEFVMMLHFAISSFLFIAAIA